MPRFLSTSLVRTLLVPVLMLVLAPALMNPSAETAALERVAVPNEGDGGAAEDGWSRSCLSEVIYYNICTGWVWLWSGFESGEKIGTAVQRTGYPEWFRMRTWEAAPAGYGYTFTVSVHRADLNLCPTGPPLIMFPQLASGDWFYGWFPGAYMDEYSIIVTMGPGEDGSSIWPTDHPAAGPTGPQALGTCYTADRPTRSFHYGSAASPECPGDPFNDGVGNAELLVEACFSYDVIGLESVTWGRVKSLYR